MIVKEWAAQQQMKFPVDVRRTMSLERSHSNFTYKKTNCELIVASLDSGCGYTRPVQLLAECSAVTTRGDRDDLCRVSITHQRHEPCGSAPPFPLVSRTHTAAGNLSERGSGGGQRSRVVLVKTISTGLGSSAWQRAGEGYGCHRAASPVVWRG